MSNVPSLTLQRTLYLESGIFGYLEHVSTLEHAYLQDDGSYKPKIPAGVGIWERYDSPKFGFEVFRCRSIDGIDQWEHGYEFHPGNWNKDSDGCPMIGEQIGNMSNGGKMLTRSDKAFEAFMARYAGVNTITVEIVE